MIGLQTIRIFFLSWQAFFSLSIWAQTAHLPDTFCKGRRDSALEHNFPGQKDKQQTKLYSGIEIIRNFGRRDKGYEYQFNVTSAEVKGRIDSRDKIAETRE